MSSQGESLLQTIEADIKGAAGWLEGEAIGFASAAWSDFKSLFTTVTAEQVSIIKGLVAEAEADETAGDDAEVTIADVLTLASAKELTWVSTLPNQVLAALTGLFKTEFGD